MANGKNVIECHNCQHFQQVSPDGTYSTGGACGYHNVLLPLVQDNRICKDFLATAEHEHDPFTHSTGIALSQFGIELKQNVLYGFPYNSPAAIKELMTLPEHVAAEQGVGDVGHKIVDV